MISTFYIAVVVPQFKFSGMQEQALPVARNIMCCVTTRQWQLWNQPYTKATFLVAKPGARVATGLLLMGARLGALNCHVAWIIRMA